MATQILGSIILWLIALAVIVVIAVYLLRWLYRRSIKETAFVRTGFGGEKVVINGGVFVIPVVHAKTPAHMNVIQGGGKRGRSHQLNTPGPPRHQLVARAFL